MTRLGTHATFRDGMTEATTSRRKRIAVIPGDGAGKDVIPEAVKVLKAAAARGGREVELTEFDWGADRYLRDGTTLPEGAVGMFRREYDAILLGALGDPRVPGQSARRRHPARPAIQARSICECAPLRPLRPQADPSQRSR